MKSILRWILLLSLSPVWAQEYSATYRVTFVGEWTAASHPIDYPSSAHFSRLIGTTHNHAGGTWQLGQLASQGIKDMAEAGANNQLNIAITNQINEGRAETRIFGQGIEGDGSTSEDFAISASHPLVSLTSMIAPSPDWFVGIHDVSLMQSGVWVDELIIELIPYDAGTDSGASFRSSDLPTLPPEPIFNITTDPLPNNVPLGFFQFSRLSVVGNPPDAVFITGFESNQGLLTGPRSLDQ